MHTRVVERLVPPGGGAELRALALLLVDAVESGAAVSFLAPLSLERAEDWWRKTIAAAQARAIFLLARDTDGIVGTVQFHPAWAPNQPHRAEVVSCWCIAGAAAPGWAPSSCTASRTPRGVPGSGSSRWTQSGAKPEHLYRRIGWTAAGTIPRYALDPDGTPHDAVIFYKELKPADAARAG